MKNLRPETLGIVQRVEALIGCPVEFKPDSSLSVQATLQKLAMAPPPMCSGTSRAVGR